MSTWTRKKVVSMRQKRQCEDIFEWSHIIGSVLFLYIKVIKIGVSVLPCNFIHSHWRAKPIPTDAEFPANYTVYSDVCSAESLADGKWTTWLWRGRKQCPSTPNLCATSGSWGDGRACRRSWTTSSRSMARTSWSRPLLEVRRGRSVGEKNPKTYQRTRSGFLIYHLQGI